MTTINNKLIDDKQQQHQYIYIKSTNKSNIKMNQPQRIFKETSV